MALMGFPHKDELCRLHQDSGAGWTSANWAGNEGNVLRKALAKRKLEIAKVESKKAAKGATAAGAAAVAATPQKTTAAAAAIAGTPPNMLPHSGSGTALSALAAASQPTGTTLRLQ